jgi:putative membrane protein
VDGRLVPGVNAIEDGVEKRLLDGVDQLLAGMDKAVAGIFQLSDGGKQAAGGANQLAGGLPALSTGAKQLAEGTGKLKAGAGKLAGGTGQLKDGAGKLANGLGDAADGSGQLADGLVQASDGAPQIVDGAQRLSTEGMGALTEAGKSTAQEFGSKYALIEAVNERAASEGMAYGAPEGANGLTAYSLELAGENGEGGRNMARGLGALAVFGLGAGLITGVRNRFF